MIKIKEQKRTKKCISRKAPAPKSENLEEQTKSSTQGVKR